MKRYCRQKMLEYAIEPKVIAVTDDRFYATAINTMDMCS